MREAWAQMKAGLHQSFGIEKIAVGRLDVHRVEIYNIKELKKLKDQEERVITQHII